jgi:hypothetical protein
MFDEFYAIHPNIPPFEETRTLLNQWGVEYNHFKPHSSRNYQPPVPKTWLMTQVSTIMMQVPLSPRVASDKGNIYDR